MKGLLFLLLMAMSSSPFAQNLTGVWRGYFISGMGEDKSRYKYEVQLDNKSNNALGGVTYSYRTTVFYGKASLQGIFMKDKSLILKENSLLEVKILDKSDPCLMTCYLDYSVNAGVEVLQGTFSSINMADKRDCGSGTVYLEKVPESDFKKEDFVVKYEARKKAKPATTPLRKSTAKTPAKPSTIAKGTKPAPSLTAKVNSTKPTSKKQATQLPPPSSRGTASLNRATPQVPTKPVAPAEPVTVPSIKDEVTNRMEMPVPREGVGTPQVLRERENSLVRKLATNSRSIKIELYDNGQLDNDTITVYHNNKVIVQRKRLSHEPITLNITADANDALHEFVMVAENLGEIPPNTALMVITTGGKRYELYIVSTEQKNAKVVIEYQEQQ